MDAPTPRTALVTGAGRRSGRVVALGLAKDGFAVAVHFNRSEKKARAVVETIVDSGGRAALVRADLGHEEQVKGLIGEANGRLGALGLLVNNASVFEDDRADTATRESWDMHMEINLRAPFVLTQAFAAQLPGGASGSVINLLDQRVWNLTPYFLTYTLSKSGLWTLTRTLALSLAPDIRVNAIGPGPVLPSARQSAEAFAAQAGATPLGRNVEAEEILGAVRFILATPSMTGQMIALDGGQHLGWAANRQPPQE
jgi:NAD(P)-dependent dehydrogenase (short-subunit alcohol dehydrogenase family)